MRLPAILVPALLLALAVVPRSPWRDSPLLRPEWQPSRRQVWSAAAVIGGLLFWYLLTRFRSGEINAIDFTIYYDRPCFQTVHGRPLFVETSDTPGLSNRSELADHAYWGMLVACAPYAVYPSPLWLHALAVLAIVAGGLHVLRIAQRLGAGGALACATALAFVLNDNTARTLNYGFHPEVLYAGFIPWMIDACSLRGASASFLAATLASVLVKEDACLPIFAATVALALNRFRTMTWSRRAFLPRPAQRDRHRQPRCLLRLRAPDAERGQPADLRAFLGERRGYADGGAGGHGDASRASLEERADLGRLPDHPAALVPAPPRMAMGPRNAAHHRPLWRVGERAGPRVRDLLRDRAHAVLRAGRHHGRARPGPAAGHERRPCPAAAAAVAVLLGPLLVGSGHRGYSLRPWKPETAAVENALAQALGNEPKVLVQSGLFPHAGYDERFQLLTPETLADPRNAGAVLLLARRIGAYPFFGTEMDRISRFPSAGALPGGLLAVRVTPDATGEVASPQSKRERLRGRSSRLDPDSGRPRGRAAGCAAADPPATATHRCRPLPRPRHRSRRQSNPREVSGARIGRGRADAESEELFDEFRRRHPDRLRDVAPSAIPRLFRRRRRIVLLSRPDYNLMIGLVALSEGGRIELFIGLLSRW